MLIRSERISMELWDAYDIDRQQKNKSLERGKPLENDDFHTVVHICIFNSRGDMLIQQRQPFKKGWSNLWDVTCGGSVLKGETSRQGAHRELLEEVGIDLDFEKLRPNFTFNFTNGFDDFYLIEKEVDVSKIKLQYEEVQAVKWASKEEILKMIDEKTFIPYFKSFIMLLFEVKGYKAGCIKN